MGYTRVDPDLFTWLAQWRWNTIAGRYAVRYETLVPGREGLRRMIYLHRYVAGATEGEQVDHINRDPLDNRLVNLRLVSDSENKQNVPARGGSSVYRGVSWDASRQKWQAKTRYQNKTYHAGRFDTEWEAALAAKALRAKLMPLAHGMT